MNIFLYDYRPDTTKIARLNPNIEELKKLCCEIELDVNVEDWLETVACEKAKEANLILGHFSDPSIESIVEILPMTNQDQVVICVTSTTGYGENFKHQLIVHDNIKRVVLYVRDMNAINTNVLKRLLCITFDDANKIIESGGAWVLGWQLDPFNTKKEALIALSILGQGYLATCEKESLERLYPLTQNSKKLVANLATSVTPNFWTDGLGGIEYQPKLKQKLAEEMRLATIDECCIGTLLNSIDSASIQPELVVEVCQLIQKQL